MTAPSLHEGSEPLSINAFLMSNSTNAGAGLLEHSLVALEEFLSDRDTLIFVPFALKDHEGYWGKIAEALEGICEVLPGHRASLDDYRNAEAYFVGGGNTFRLLRHLQDNGLLEVVKQRVSRGAKYIGASAGTAVAGLSIRTTNDMPIVQTKSLDSLGLVNCHFNCHYVDPPSGPRTFMGETRDERLGEFLEENHSDVVTLREGAWIEVEDGVLRMSGSNGGRLFRRGIDPIELPSDSVIPDLESP